MIELPKNCLVDKFIPKKSFYEKVNMSNSLKEEFVYKLGKIYWKYKISENTINISKTEKVEEIEVFELELKEKYDSKNLIRIITQKIPYPILFYIKFNKEFQYAIKYDNSVFLTDWNEEIQIIIKGFDLEQVYNNIVKSIVNIDNSVKDLDYEIQKKNRINRLNEEIKKLESKIRSEKQFNIKAQYNDEINKIKKEIEGLL